MKHKKAIIKDISLSAAILTIIFMILVIIYQMTAGNRDLANDLNTVFSSVKK